MIKLLNLSDENTLKEILFLQKLSYEIEADILNFKELPPLTESLHSLKNSKEIYFGYFEETKLIGFISYRFLTTFIEIHKLAIHPKHFRTGLATKLLSHIEALHQDLNIRVSTGKNNLPATELYRKNNFSLISETVVEKNLVLSHFERKKVN